MKVRKVLDKLKIGDTVWVKAKVAAVDQDYDFNPIVIKFFSDEIWLHEKDEISLTEPKPELVEVQQFVADWYEANKDDLEQALYETTIEISEKGTKNEFEDWFIDGSTDSYEILTRMKYGYTVKQEPKWIVKTSDGYWVNSITSNLHNSKVIDFSDNKRPSLIFLDKKTAEAVATLIDGEVEEV